MTRRRSAWVHGAEVIAALALVAVVAVVVVRVKPGKTSDQSTATTVATSSVPSGGQSAPVSAGTPAAAHLPQLEQKASTAMSATFEATYQAKGANSTIVFAQKGLKSSFSTGTTSYYSDGATSTVCDTSSGAPSCYTGAKPLAGLLSLIDPSQESSAIQAANTEGLAVSYSSATHDGQLSSCISYTKAGQRLKYCIDDHGIVTYIRIPTGAFELTAYTTDVSDAQVSVPTNATMVPAPSTP